MSHPEDFRDLAPLSPRLDPARWERMAAGISAAAAPELAHRAAAPDLGLLVVLSSWARPALSAAAALAIAAGGALVLQGAFDSREDTAVASVLGYPSTVAAWVETGRTPSVEELVYSLDAETP
jgi:hypothetical protein